MNKKVFVAITSPISIVLLKGQLQFFSELGYSVSLLCPYSKESIQFANSENVRLIPIDFKREVSFFNDLICLFKLIFLMLKESPDIVNAGTPKASLLTLLAAKLVGTKKRVYTCRGLRFESETGVKRKLLMLMEKLTAFSSHHIICISNSVRNKSIELKIFPVTKTVVIGHGSSNGIDLEYFSKDNPLIPNISINTQSFVFGFIGRFVERKGINELVEAFVELNDKDTTLLMVGGFDTSQQPSKNTVSQIHSNKNIISIEWTDDIRPYLKKMDVFVLPAYWEGFGNVLIQAAAFGLPIISTKTSGCMDAVSHEYNGTLIEPKDVEQLVSIMKCYKNNHEQRTNHGQNGLKWVQNFKQQVIWHGLNQLYLDDV